VFRALSVFCGGFTRAAAQEVAGASLRELMALVSKSLLHRAPTGRYIVHELLRQYAAEKLKQSPTAERAASSRHCAFYASAAQQWATDLRGPRQQEVLSEVDTEIENAQTAWSQATEQAWICQLDKMIDVVCHYYARRGRLLEGQIACGTVAAKLAKAAESRSAPPSSPAPEAAVPDIGRTQRVLVKALAWQGSFARMMGEVETAGRLLEQGMALLDQIGNTQFPSGTSGQDTRMERAFVLIEMGRQALDLDRDKARRCFAQSLALYRELGDQWGAARVLYNMGWLLEGLGDYGQAQQALTESLALREALSDQRGIADTLALQGLISVRQGQLEDGERLLSKSVALLERLGEQVSAADGLVFLAHALLLQGKFEQATRSLQELLAVASDLGLGHQRGMALVSLGHTQGLLGQYDQARVHAQAALGHAQELGDRYVIGTAYSTLGGIALVKEAYEEASEWLGPSVAAFEEMGQRDGTSWSLALLGCAALRLGQVSQSRRQIHKALQMSTMARAFFPLTFALSGTALLLTHLGETERALELWALLSRYDGVANAHLFHDLVGKHVAAAAATLPPDVVAAAEERGRGRDLWAMAEELLAELGEP
jgi:tetratricopeptide (TPR) repeat protein